MQRPVSGLIPSPLPSQAFTANSLWLTWNLLRGQVFGISPHYFRRRTPSWILPLLSRVFFLIPSLKGLGRDAKRRERYLYSHLPKDKSLETSPSGRTSTAPIASCSPRDGPLDTVSFKLFYQPLWVFST